MGATTKSGRTRNRRVQSIATTIQGQPPLLFVYQASLVDAHHVNIGVWDSTINPAGNLAVTPNARLRIALVNGTGYHEENAVVTFAGGGLAVVTTEAMIVGDNIVVLPWNESVRGQYGEWLAPTILDIVL